MIAFLKGQVIEKGPNYAIILTNGIGFLVHITIPTYAKLKIMGEEVSFYTHTVFKENAIEIYGFETQQERELFKVLLTASGIGAKLGLSILSGISPGDLIGAILRGESRRLTTIPGIGKKLAERIVFELKDKVKRIGFVPHMREEGIVEGDWVHEAVSALTNLGYKGFEAEEAVMAVKDKSPTLEDLIKNALRQLAQGRR
jgi:Holliday junction DNA helicase RuvA